VSAGRFALRGISRAQDLYTLDPDILSDEVVAGKIRALCSGLARIRHPEERAIARVSKGERPTGGAVHPSTLACARTSSENGEAVIAGMTGLPWREGL